MSLLAIETSSAVASIALCRGSALVAARAFPSRMSLCQNLTREIEALLGHLEGEALNAVAVSLGPGSFTSLRIGVMTAKALAHRLALPLVGVPTLEVIATPFAFEASRLIAVLQPGWKGIVYLATYQGGASGTLQGLSGPAALELPAAIERLQATDGELLLAGEAVIEHRDALAGALGGRIIFAPPPLCVPQAQFVAEAARARLAAATPPPVHAIRPLYVVASQAERQAGIDLGMT
jgi:tRNA threonylcarbamoyladenosine biosynthesis protein TsaB